MENLSNVLELLILFPCKGDSFREICIRDNCANACLFVTDMNLRPLKEMRSCTHYYIYTIS